uniref:hypothetical protein n=1 Tax=Bacillus multifaciens TaxID=3068506 RepID=UPI003F4960E3
MMTEKRKDRFMLTTSIMPQRVYETLNEKSRNKSLTNYVIELVEKQDRDQELISKLLTKLERIETTLEQMKDAPISFKVKNDVSEEIESKMVESSLTEGEYTTFKKFECDVDEDDVEDEMDF